MLETAGTIWLDQCLVFLLEARAREFTCVARRKSKGNQVPAASQDVRGVVVIRDQSLM